MSPEAVSDLREVGNRGFNFLYHPEYTWDAGYGSFSGGVFGRDILKSLKLIFSRPANITIPFLLQRAERALDFLAHKQGRMHDPSSDEFEGRIIHELRNGLTSPEVMVNLEEVGFPVRKRGKRVEMKYYGASEVTSLFIGVVYDLADMKGLAVGTPDSKEYLKERNKYLKKMWPPVRAAFWHQARLAATSGYDLIDSTPQNISALFNHVEADSDYSYLTEKGVTPRPPNIFLESNSHFLEAMVKVQPMAEVMEDREILEEAQKRYQRGEKAFHQLFWMVDEDYYSPLVDGDGQQVKIIRADSIDALWCGILKQPFADRVIDRLLELDMYVSPWGIRSRSSYSTQFRVNGPYAYWNGAVWTHQQAEAAIGFERYGRFEEAQLMDEALFTLTKAKGAVEVSAVSEDGRLLDYKEHRIPKANNPQLFAAAALLARTAPREFPLAA